MIMSCWLNSSPRSDYAHGLTVTSWRVDLTSGYSSGGFGFDLNRIFPFSTDFLILYALRIPSTFVTIQSSVTGQSYQDYFYFIMCMCIEIFKFVDGSH